MEEAFVRESRVAYIPVSSQIRQIIPFKLEQTELSLQDNPAIKMADLTAISVTNLFTLRRMETRTYERPDNTLVSVTIEMGQDLN